MTYQIISGTTALLRFQLLEAGAPINLTGAQVALLLADKTGATVSNPGTVSVTDAINGKISLAPTNGSVFVASLSPYSARWQVTDGSGKVYYVPTGPRDTWEITGA